MPLSADIFRGTDLTTMEERMHGLQEQHLQTKKEIFPPPPDNQLRELSKDNKSNISVQTEIEQQQPSTAGDTPAPVVTVPGEEAVNGEVDERA